VTSGEALLLDEAGALDVLAEGGVVAAPTETWFGLLADATQPRALDRLLRVKPREAGRGIGLLLPDRSAWSALVAELPVLALRLADAFWPGPLTIVLPAAAGLDARLLAGGTIAVRLGADSPAARLAQALGRPLTATSANPPGTPPARHAGEAREAFADALAAGRLVLLAGQAPGGPASTLVELAPGSTGWRASLLREGAIRREALASVLGPALHPPDEAR
jgi:L-threonylcarbamoyladenylate synthase